MRKDILFVLLLLSVFSSAQSIKIIKDNIKEL